MSDASVIRHLTGTGAPTIERELQKARLEVIGRFAGGLAHDLNNLFAAIVSFTHLAKDGLSSFLDETASEAESLARVGSDLDRVEEVTARAARLIGQIDFFRTLASSGYRETDVAENLRALQGRLATLTGDEVRLTVQVGAPAMFACIDPGHLEMMVEHLVLNAVEAMPSGGQVSIEASFIDIDQRRAALQGLDPGRYVQLSVSDSGEGMSADVAERAWEPFFSTKSKAARFGIGLTIVYAIALHSDGHVSMASEIGEGTTVNVFVPVPPDNGTRRTESTGDVMKLGDAVELAD